MYVTDAKRVQQNNSYKMIQLCTRCKKKIELETIQSEFRTKPVYKIVDTCERCIFLDKEIINE